MTTNILIVGTGGQGVVLAGEILAHVAVASGLDAKKSEIHGMSQRGGVVSSHVRFGDKVASPIMVRVVSNYLTLPEHQWKRPSSRPFRPGSKTLTRRPSTRAGAWGARARCATYNDVSKEIKRKMYAGEKRPTRCDTCQDGARHPCRCRR